MAEVSKDPIVVTAFARSDIGRVRDLNEDRFLVTDFSAFSRRDNFSEPATFPLDSHGALLLVCDGLGGCPAGDVAADIAVRVIGNALTDAARADDEDLPILLAGALKRANAEVRLDASLHPRRRGMGTTATAAFLRPGGLFVGHVGDSRCYVLRQGRLTAVTANHTVAAHLVEAGVMTPEEAAGSGYLNVLRQAVGTERTIDVALSRIPLRRDDLVLVCSDGLHAFVPGSELERILGQGGNLKVVSDALIDAAFKAGAPDNVTFVMAQLTGPGMPQLSGTEPVKAEPVKIESTQRSALPVSRAPMIGPGTAA